jgi:saccharopine dehydrogenase-like NADP-dependent oxidoreductase
MTKVAILGAGHIGVAVYHIIRDLKQKSKYHISPHNDVEAFVIDKDQGNLLKLPDGDHIVGDLEEFSSDELAQILMKNEVTHVMNALPFFMNKKIASATVKANCHYIDFTEDDIMADSVQKLYEGSGLTCAVKCGLAPGFINYLGHSMATKIEAPETLMISVGALPRLVSYSSHHPEESYNLTWSVDGLVNEYIRPCRIRKDKVLQEVAGLNNTQTVILDGIEYEAALTSGGIGSLVDELDHIPNVHYMTLRYPGHYRYIREVVQELNGDFEKIKETFLRKFPTTQDDVIVVYAKVTGRDSNALCVKNYSEKFYGVDNLTAIQSTTAGGGVAVLEMMLEGRLSGIVNHSHVDLTSFTQTMAYTGYYRTK